jgi:large subunit ribosomal protein L17
MRHKNSGRQFGRNSSHRRAMLRSLTANLIAHERIETTDAKAKELRRVAERVITKARRLGEVAYTPQDKLSLADRARRHAAQKQVAQFLQRLATVEDGEDDAKRVDLIEKVFVDLAQRYKGRPGGYTRIIKVGNRRGDNAPISIIELVAGEEPKKKGSKKKAVAPAEEKAAKVEAKPAKAEKSEAKQAEGKDEKAAKKPAKKTKKKAEATEE